MTTKPNDMRVSRETVSFEFRHPANGEAHTVSVSLEEIAHHMCEVLFEKLCDEFCQCEPVGETNVVDCRCDEYADEFERVKSYAQPATAKVVLPEREILRDVIAAVIGGDAYDCTRVWSAWGVGTMSDDDFVPIVEQEERLYELVDACLDEVAKLNNQPS